MANTILIDQPQPPNTILAGPASGAVNGVPSQRKIVAADLTAAYGLSGNTLCAFTQTATKTVTASVVNTTPTSLVGTGVGSVIIPTASLGVGKQVRIIMRGRFTTGAASTPTLAFTINATTTGGTVALATVPGQTVSNSLTDAAFVLAADIVFRQDGSASNVMTQGLITLNTTAVPIVTNAPASVVLGTGFTNPVTLDILVTYSNSTALNSISTETFLIEIAN